MPAVLVETEPVKEGGGRKSEGRTVSHAVTVLHMYTYLGLAGGWLLGGRSPLLV